MIHAHQFEAKASSRRGAHDGESSLALCDWLSRTRDTSQRQLPTDQDYAVSTREYQTDQSSLKTAPTAARSVLELRRKQRQQQTQRLQRLTRSLHIRPKRSLSIQVDQCSRQVAVKPATGTTGVSLLLEPISQRTSVREADLRALRGLLPVCP